jgi:hypothetical protein
MPQFDPKDYETKLDPQQEAGFQSWFKDQVTKGTIGPNSYAAYQKQGYGDKYDFRAAYQAGVVPEINPIDNAYHWSDIGKKPNHETFSVESKYANVPGARPGSWEGQIFTPYGQGSKSKYGYEQGEGAPNGQEEWLRFDKTPSDKTPEGKPMKLPDGRPIRWNGDGTFATGASTPEQKQQDEAFIKKTGLDQIFYKPVDKNEVKKHIQDQIRESLRNPAYADFRNPEHEQTVARVRQMSEVLAKQFSDKKRK